MRGAAQALPPPPVHGSRCIARDLLARFEQACDKSGFTFDETCAAPSRTARLLKERLQEAAVKMGTTLEDLQALRDQQAADAQSEASTRASVAVTSETSSTPSSGTRLKRMLSGEQTKKKKKKKKRKMASASS